MPQTKKKISLSTQVLIGLALGVVTGLFLGDLAAPLGRFGQAFINLLMMTVLPYVVLSLIAGLGRLSVAEAKSLALNGGRVLVILWVIVLTTVVLISFAFPIQESASFFSAAMVQQPREFDFVALYIPENPFRALANTVVPAVVLFSIAVGLALIGVPNKEGLIEQLDALVAAVTRVAGFVGRLAPYGVFAVVANTAGTMEFSQLDRLQVYLVTYALSALLLTFWVLPALVTSLTNISYRQLFDKTREALLLAFATGNLLIVLPLLAEQSKAILEKNHPDSEEAQGAVDVLIPASFNFPNLGKLLTLSFVPFVAWFVGKPVELAQYPMYLGAGFASFFGEVIIAVPFLLQLLELPRDLFQIFIAVDVFVGFFGTLLAGMHVLVFTLLGSYAMAGLLHVRWARLLRNLVVTLAIAVVSVAGLRLLFGQTLGDAYDKDKVLAGMQMIRRPLPATVYTEPPPIPTPLAAEPQPTRLMQIRTRQVIRVGYFHGHVPYTFFNLKGELVGFDAEMAHTLARELDVSLEFVPVDPDRIAEQLVSGYCDIVMSGVVVTTERAREVAFSEAYLDGTMAFLTKDHRVKEFNSAHSVRALRAPRIGAGNHPYYMSRLRDWLPGAEIVPMATSREIREYLKAGRDDLDAIMMPAEEASAWSVLFPAFDVAIPHPAILNVPLAYALPQDAEELIDLVNTWITLKKSDQTIERLYDHWILGKRSGPTEPRWSVIRNVLGWVDY